MAAAASTILSIPGCEQPTTSTTPSGVLIARDSSLSSFVPGVSDTNAISVIPGTISVVLSINSKLAPCHAAPNFMTSGGPHESGEAPVLGHRRIGPECVVEDGDLVVGLGRSGPGRGGYGDEA